MLLSSCTLRRTAFCLLAMVSGVCAAQQQFVSVPEVQPTTGGRVTSFVTGSFQFLQPTGLPDILYINAPTGSGTTSSVLVGEMLNSQGFTDAGENQIIFKNVSNVVAAVGAFDGDVADYAFALSPTVAGTTNLCIYAGTGAPVVNRVPSGVSYSGGSLYPPMSGKSGCMTIPTMGTLLPNFTYIAGLPFKTNSSTQQLIVEDSANGYLYILANDGSGGANGVLTGVTVKTVIQLAPADGPGPIYVADLDGDGSSDFVVNGQTGRVATVYMGNGDGTFKAPVRYFAGSVHSMLLQDMDHDGVADLVAEGANGVISIYKGNHTATNTFASTSEGGTPVGVDGFTGNGGHLAAINPATLDILTATPIGLSVLQNQGGLSYNVLKGIYNIGPGRTSFVLGNFLASGRLDLAVDSPEGVAFAPADSNGDGGFQTSRAYPALQPALGAVAGRFRNLANNPNGNRDVVVATGATQAQLLIGNGDGTFTPSASQANLSGGPTLDPTLATFWSNILSGDFNGDGKVDIAYSLQGFDSQVPVNGAGPEVYVQYGNGDGSFQAPVGVSNTVAGNYIYGESAVGDFNGDGVADLANINPTGSAFNDTLLGQTGGGFSLGLNAVSGKNPSFGQVAAGLLQSGMYQAGPGLRAVRSPVPVSEQRRRDPLHCNACDSECSASRHAAADGHGWRWQWGHRTAERQHAGQSCKPDSQRAERPVHLVRAWGWDLRFGTAFHEPEPQLLPGRGGGHEWRWAAGRRDERRICGERSV